jgi:5-methylthioadenosine/S-adenosylhomocysteine deaminase
LTPVFQSAIIITSLRKCNEQILNYKKTPVTLLIRNCSYLIRNSTQIERDCDILLDGGRIGAIGKNLTAPPGTEIIDGHGCAIIPGLVNAHTHLYQNLLKGISPGLTLVPWCNDVLFPYLGAIRGAMERDDKRLSYLWTALASIEMIRGGITSCVDMDATTPEILHAWTDIGFRGVVAYTLSNKWVPAELRADEETMKQQMLDFIQNYHHPDGLTTVNVAPSTLFLCTDDFLLWAGEQARIWNLGMQIHIAETAGEVADQIKETGRTPVEHLAHLGLLSERLSAVHVVHVNERDMNLLADAGAYTVHCPKSNMKLSDGIAPVSSLQKKGIPVGLGTDGCASNDLLDMWEEIRAAILLARVSENQPDVMIPQDVFKMATITGAQVARIDAGELQVGKVSDLAVVELSGIHLQPIHGEDILNNLVFCAKSNDVRDTIIHGEVVMRDRKITKVNEQALLEETEAITSELFARHAES